MKKVLCLTTIAIITVLLCFYKPNANKINEHINYTIYCEKWHMNNISEKAQQIYLSDTAKQELRIEDGSTLSFYSKPQVFTDDTAHKEITYVIDGKTVRLPYSLSYEKPFFESEITNLKNIGTSKVYSDMDRSGIELKIREGTGEVLAFYDLSKKIKEGSFTSKDAEKAAAKLIESLYGKDVFNKFVYYRTEELGEDLNNNILVQYARFIGDFKTEEMITVYYDRQGNVTAIFADRLGYIDAYGSALTEEKVLAAEKVLRKCLPKEMISDERTQFFVDVDSTGDLYLCIYLLTGETTLDRFSINIL